jgi:hypothetical protein
MAALAAHFSAPGDFVSPRCWKPACRTDSGLPTLQQRLD